MVRKVCKECGKTVETDEKQCDLCGGGLVTAGVPKSPKSSTTPKFSGESDLNRQSPGDFTPVAVRSITPKVPNRTVLDIGKQEKRTSRQKIKTAAAIIGTVVIAFILAMSIRHFFGDYNVKFTQDNVEKRQAEQQAE